MAHPTRSLYQHTERVQWQFRLKRMVVAQVFSGAATYKCRENLSFPHRRMPLGLKFPVPTSCPIPVIGKYSANLLEKNREEIHLRLIAGSRFVVRLWIDGSDSAGVRPVGMRYEDQTSGRTPPVTGRRRHLPIMMPTGCRAMTASLSTARLSPVEQWISHRTGCHLPLSDMAVEVVNKRCRGEKWHHHSMPS